MITTRAAYQNRTDIASLEGWCTAFVLMPREARVRARTRGVLNLSQKFVKNCCKPLYFFFAAEIGVEPMLGVPDSEKMLIGSLNKNHLHLLFCR